MGVEIEAVPVLLGDEQVKPTRREPVFEKKITLGNLITLTTIVVTLTAAWVTTNSRVGIAELNIGDIKTAQKLDNDHSEATRKEIILMGNSLILINERQSIMNGEQVRQRSLLEDLLRALNAKSGK